METRGLNDVTPDEWTASSKRTNWGFRGRSSADFVPTTPPEGNTTPSCAVNPKARVGALKAPLHLVPPVATIQMALALADGASKYGAFNYRKEPINVSTYVGAILRHLAAFQDGEDVADDSGVHHLSHVMACCALLLDSESMGILIDDRPPASGAPALLDKYHKENMT